MKRLVRSFFNLFGYDFVKAQYNNADFEKHLSNVIAAKNIDCIIDVGANKGQYGESLRKMGYKGRIVSFEPVKSVFNVLKEKCDKDDRWDCYNLALGDKKEEKTINVYQSTVFSSFLQANEYSKNIWQSLENVTPEVVNVVRLDDVYAELVGRTGCTNCMLKLDTQGYDKQAFDGAIGSLKHILALQSELALIPVYDGMLPVYDVLKIFHEHNFFISGMYPINRDESLAVIEYDCVLVKKESAPKI
ncbi:MAG: FkbM family methyltransferase [Nitrospirae bacterium]|nr:MAG: FkbM family methyltransferase [Nitrospirota bacterium]